MIEPIESEHLLSKRRELERKLAALLKATKSRYTLEDIKIAINEETSQRDLAKIVEMFDSNEGGVEIHEVMPLVVGAWNCFPHRSLGGRSPEEMR